MFATQDQHLNSSFSKWLMVALVAALPLGVATGTAFRGVIAAFRGVETAIVQASVRQALRTAPEFPPALVEIPPHLVSYHPAGSFDLHNAVVDAPPVTVTSRKHLRIMRNQVSVTEYGECVAAGGCKPRRASDAGANFPAVLVSWEDATDYAVWLSRKTGKAYRLPTDEEWIMAAGSRAPNRTLVAASADNPSQRWLAEYRAEANVDTSDSNPKPPGAFGANEYGVADLAGNVWEWTNTCFIRATVSEDGLAYRATTVNCGVRVVEGQHRTFVPNFLRDARGGGCSAGKPPSNLGFRLVRDEG